MKLLFVVHRYGYPGGSENNVKQMAEEAASRGIETWVLSDDHKQIGFHNNIMCTNDRKIVLEKFDMIIVHGSCPTQDFIHANSVEINKISPIYYLLIEPPKTSVAFHGANHCTWIGCGTTFDRSFIESRGLQKKQYQFKYGINTNSIGQGHFFRRAYNIETPYIYLSVGGFWPHKRLNEIANAFTEVNPKDTTLVLMGYNTSYSIPEETDKIRVITDGSQADVYNAMDAAQLYIMNSETEGFGLTIIESMYNKTPWIAHNIAAAHDLKKILPEQYLPDCSVYSSYYGLVNTMASSRPSLDKTKYTILQEIVQQNFTSKHSLDSILKVLQ